MSPSSLINHYVSLLEFIGPKVKKLLLLDIVAGFLWFGIESSFVFIIQGLLASINYVDPSLSILPAWYPRSLEINIILLICFGVTRTLVIMLKNFCVVYSSQIFYKEKRSLLLKNALKSNSGLSNNDTVSTFSELISHAGNHVTHAANLIHSVVVSGLLVLACFKLAPKETLLGLSMLACFLFPMRKLSRKVSSYGKDMISSWNISYETLLNGLKNIFFLKLHDMTGHEIEKGEEALERYMKNYKSYAITSSFVLGLPQFAGILVLSATVWASVNYFYTSSHVLLSFLYLFIRLAQNAAQSNSQLSYFKLTTVSFNKLKDIFKNFKKTNENKDKNLFISENDHFKLLIENLKVGYNNQALQISPINLTLGIGDFFLIKGPSGVGKTTLLRTIVGELPPVSGEVKINGIPVEKTSNLAQFIGYVGPEPFLFYGSVRENLLYGNKNRKIKDNDIWDCLTKLGLENQIRKFPGGLDEILLDETQLSSGQKQRLSFARALIRKPKILILDEATANIDYDTEKKILDLLLKLKKDVLVITISHKESFDEFATTQINF